jgi:hypothetical protein
MGLNALQYVSSMDSMSQAISRPLCRVSLYLTLTMYLYA